MSVEAFSEQPAPCPKCSADSAIVACRAGRPVRRPDGSFQFVYGTENADEHLVVRCGRCDYERLMEVAS